MKEIQQIQLELFELPVPQNEILWDEIKNLKENFGKTRRKIFKELTEMKELQLMQFYKMMSEK